MAHMRTVGTLIYYFGFLTLLLGLFSLAMGVSAIFSSVSTQMAAATSSAGVSSSTSPDAASIDTLSEPNSMVIYLFDPFVEPFSLVADAYLERAGFLPLPEDMQMTFYPHFRRFYGFLALGILLMVLGTLLKVSDQFIDFFGGKRSKLPANFLRVKPEEERRLRHRAMAEDED